MSYLPSPPPEQTGKRRIELHRKNKHFGTWTPTDDDMGIKVNDICKPCNEGWMHDLETDVTPLLGPMIRSTTNVTSINEKQMTLLTAWCYKITLVFDLIAPTPDRRLASDRYSKFFQRPRQPPLGGVVIWIGSFRGSMTSTATDRGITFGTTIPAIVATYSIGRFAFQVLTYDPDAFPPSGLWIPNIPDGWRRRLALAWPILGEQGGRFSFAWPPSQVMNDRSMIAFRNRWNTPNPSIPGVLLR